MVRFAKNDFTHGSENSIFIVNFQFFEEKMTESDRNRLKIVKF